VSNKILGNYGESMAREYLMARGYRILEENFRTKLGEIDLIARDGEVVCFVEVKTRRSLAQGHPAEAVHPWKVRKLTQMALSYLKYRYRSVDVSARFDVVCIVRDGDNARIEHIENAFDAVY
jgi:putative endonuclease